MFNKTRFTTASGTLNHHGKTRLIGRFIEHYFIALLLIERFLGDIVLVVVLITLMPIPIEWPVFDFRIEKKAPSNRGFFRLKRSLICEQPNSHHASRGISHLHHQGMIRRPEQISLCSLAYSMGSAPFSSNRMLDAKI